MSTPIIQVENLAKRYIIGHQAQQGDGLRHAIENAIRAPLNWLRTGQLRSGRTLEEFWALRDVNLDVKEGEVIGIIGRNGAGKSTLLKILSRITDPTSGRVHIRGRVASLLEVGTGFHPELTGRENIFLNGAILGMSRLEIKEKFDEIVAFSEVERFLDTPVKKYSSGMYVRLAFAVAAHLEPEILIVDEVLAVGDAAFQRKCLGKMGAVAREGRTVLFVSHNIPSVVQLCSKTLLLERGKVKTFDTTAKAVGLYLLARNPGQAFVDFSDYSYRQGTQEIRFEWAELRNSGQESCREFSIGDDVAIAFSIKSLGKRTNQPVKLAVELRTSDGLRVANMIDRDSGFKIEVLEGTQSIEVRLNDVRLYPGMYYVSFWAGSVGDDKAYDYIEDCLSFDIVGGGSLTTRSLPRSGGLFFLTPEWSQVSEKHERGSIDSSLQPIPQIVS